MIKSSEKHFVVDAALTAAKASSGTLEDRICAFLRALPLPGLTELGQYGLYNTQLLAFEIEQAVVLKSNK